MFYGIIKIIKKCKNYFDLGCLNASWRNKNTHNYTTLGNIVEIEKISVGKGTYGDLFVIDFESNNELHIGCYCSIADNVKFLLAGGHNLENISTYPFKRVLLHEFPESISKGNIVIDDDVWIGINSVILSGVHIGQGAVVGAGSLVTKDIPPYTVVGGVPARIIKKRFSDDIIERLLQIDFNKIDKEFVEKNISLLYQPVTEDYHFTKFPQKIDSMLDKTV